MRIKNLIKNIDKQENFEHLIGFIQNKFSGNIQKYSIKDMQILGRILTLLNKHSDLSFNNEKMSVVNDKVVLSFCEVINETKDLKEIKEVLVCYPSPILDGVIKQFPKANELIKLKNVRELTISFQKDLSLLFDENKVKLNKGITTQINKNELNKKLDWADDLDDKIKEVGISSLEKVLKKIEAKKEEINNKIEETSEFLGPFIHSNYTKEEIREWLESIDDKGLFPLDIGDVDINASTEEIYDYVNLRDNKPSINETAKHVPKSSDLSLDIEKAETRIQGETDLDATKIIERDVPITSASEDNQLVLESGEQSSNEERDVIKFDEENQLSTHYKQGDVISRLKDEHKKGTSI